MRAVVVYESMYGNTRLVAEAIGRGLARSATVEVVPVARGDAAAVADADLLVVGGPTHAHGMSRPSTRTGAGDSARKAGSDLTLEPGFDGPGVRDWLQGVGKGHIRAAAFDTRINGPALLTGRASKGIARELRKGGFDVMTAPESFLVTAKNRLLDGEEARAEAWASGLALRLASTERRAS